MHQLVSKSRITGLIVAIVMFLSLGSCDDNMIYDESFACENQVWKSNDIKTFKFNITDTLTPVNIFVNLRTTIDYEYSNMYVFMYSEYPDGTEEKDTLDFLMAAPDGKWYGENSGTIVSFHALIASGGRFGISGEYIFQLEHAMQDEDLAEVVDVGMRIENMPLPEQ